MTMLVVAGVPYGRASDVPYPSPFTCLVSILVLRPNNVVENKKKREVPIMVGGSPRGKRAKGKW